MAADFPESEQSRKESKEKATMPFIIQSHIHTITSATLFIRSKSVNTATFKTKGIKLYLLKEGRSKIFGSI